MDAQTDGNNPGAGLLEAISHAVRVLDGGGGEEQALRESFRMACRGLTAERGFLARVTPERYLGDMLEAQGLTPKEILAFKLYRSSPGLSVWLVNETLQSGLVQHVEDSRLLVTDFSRTDSLKYGEYSVVCAPVADPDTRNPLALLYFQTHSLRRPLTAADLPHVHSYAVALSHTWRYWSQVQRERAATRADLIAAREGLETIREGEILGPSAATTALRERLRDVIVPAMAAARPQPILVLGPTGVGKELVVQTLHASSRRARGPLVSINCAVLNGEVVESKLFGHVKGAYTGANRDAEGLISEAHGGTLFFDEVGDMPPEGQALLLRALDTYRIRRLGGTSERAIDVQVICATNVDLDAAQHAGRFRPDLYHRIAGLQVRVQPLCERRDDIVPLLLHFVACEERALTRLTDGPTPELIGLLSRYDWPGNVRQLMKTCAALVAQTKPGQPITAATLAAAEPAIHAAATHVTERRRLEELIGTPNASLEDVRLAVDRAFLEKVGRECDWNISAMARRLKIDRKTLYRRCRQVGLRGEIRALRAGKGGTDTRH